ncbi:TonB-dependent receptor [Lewinella sp. 4G2]|uniref:TonB-dependent receptor n=1 Tax=Lewinella sp. 4G2 TaxID=1803372 RepID=UPI0007B47DB3|nr:TonB-dependent receptor [Lewinella sp. 4G2]OAV44887.1 hypothetical protein A3850_010460 [Lewinella sp. 4G2]
MKHFLLLTLTLFFCTCVSAQTEIVGTVVDSSGTTLPGANAVLLRSSDSLLTAFGTTDDKGIFRMENVAPGDYLLRLSFIGFERGDQTLKITAEDQYLGLGELRMYPAGFLLNGIEVTADRIPIRMVGDTMMYDAEAFAVGENAVVEDLLRRLPGMTVDANGQITWRGKPISEVMINGKPFFGGNTTLLTQNLDAKAVKNIEVYDQKSDDEEITGNDDGNENITVNLETKEEFKAKVFGDVYAGGGTQERYQAGGKGFRISDATQWGVLGTINNINKVGFSGDEISGFNSSSGRGGGFWWSSNESGDQTQGLQRDGDATGDNRSIAAGLNFGKTIGKDGQLTADYALFDRNQTQLSENLQSFNRTGDNRVIATDETNAAQSYRHSFGAELRQKIDTTGRLRVNANFNISAGDNQDFSNTLVKEAGVDDQDFLVDNNSEVGQSNGSLSASYNVRSKTNRERSWRFRVGGDYSTNQRDVDLLTEGLGEDLAVRLPGALIDGRQRQDRLTNTLNFNGQATYREPISEKWNLSLGTEFTRDAEEGDYRFIFNEATTTNILEKTWTQAEGSVGLIRRYEKGGNLNFGVNYQNATLGLAGDIDQSTNFNYVLPYIGYRKRLKKGYLSLNARTSVREPGIQRLQTIAQPSVTGQISVGNPDLTPQEVANANGYLWFNDQFKAISIYGNGGVTYTDNAFGNEVTFTNNQQVFKPINVSHAWGANFNLGGTIGMAFLNGQMEINGGAFWNRGEGIVDGASRTNINANLNASANITTELNEDSYFTFGYGITDQSNRFDDAESANTNQVVHNISVSTGLEFTPILRLESRFAYNIYAETDFAPKQELYDAVVSLEVRPFKKKGHYVRLSGSDLFNQNQVINRRVTQFITSETSANSLGRYFLATFFYKL